jgi:hypothetical protein
MEDLLKTTNLFATIFVLKIGFLGSYDPKRLLAGKSVADSNRGRSWSGSPRKVAAQLLKNTKKEKISDILWDMHKPIPIPPHSKMLNWKPERNSWSPSNSNGRNLLRSPGSRLSST